MKNKAKVKPTVVWHKITDADSLPKDIGQYWVRWMADSEIAVERLYEWSDNHYKSNFWLKNYSHWADIIVPEPPKEIE